MDDVVFFLEHPHASIKAVIVESMDVGEIFQTHRPKTCNKKIKRCETFVKVNDFPLYTESQSFVKQ